MAVSYSARSCCGLPGTWGPGTGPPDTCPPWAAHGRHRGSTKGHLERASPTVGRATGGTNARDWSPGTTTGEVGAALGQILCWHAPGE